jgi:hypothetical protein
MVQILLRLALLALAALGFIIRHRGGTVLIVIIVLVGGVFAPRHMVEAILGAAIVGSAVTIATLLNDSF